MGEGNPPETATIILPISALSGIGGKPAVPEAKSESQFWSLDFYKLVGGGICAVVAAMWTAHLYLENDWKESAVAITNVSRSIDEISYFCTSESPSTEVPPDKPAVPSKKPTDIQLLGKLMLSRLLGDSDAGKVLAASISESEAVPTLCARAVFETRQMIAVARTRVVRPWSMPNDNWQALWAEVTTSIDKVTDYGIGVGGRNLTELRKAWRTLLSKKGL